MALLFKSFRDFVDNHYAFLGVGAAVSATALLALGCYYQNHRRRKRNMSFFPNLKNNRTIMAKHLTPDIFAKVKDKCTTKKYNLEKLIESGLEPADGASVKIPAGLLAGDEECYDVFSDLIDPVIGDIHQADQSFRSQVNLDWKQIRGGELYEGKVLCCRLSGSRNIQGYRLVPACRATELLDVSHVIVKTLKSIEGKR